MSDQEVTQAAMSVEDRAHFNELEGAVASYGDGKFDAAVMRFESLALENARLKAEVAHLENAFAFEQDCAASLRRGGEALADERSRLRKMLNEANARITALVDAAEEARHEAIEQSEAREMREDRGY